MNGKPLTEEEQLKAFVMIKASILGMNLLQLPTQPISLQEIKDMYLRIGSLTYYPTPSVTDCITYLQKENYIMRVVSPKEAYNLNKESIVQLGQKMEADMIRFCNQVAILKTETVFTAMKSSGKLGIPVESIKSAYYNDMGEVVLVSDSGVVSLKFNAKLKVIEQIMYDRHQPGKEFLASCELMAAMRATPPTADTPPEKEKES